jgi:hypothetical protein
MTVFRIIEDDEEGRILKDGERLRVPMLLMDSLQRDIANNTRPAILHRPGPLPITDAHARQKRCEARDARLADAWRTGTPDAANEGGANEGGAAPRPNNGPDAPTTARIARDARLEQAWR